MPNNAAAAQSIQPREAVLFSVLAQYPNKTLAVSFRTWFLTAWAEYQYMTITYTAGWYALWRGIVVYLYFNHPYLLRGTLFLLLFFLLPLPFLVWMAAPIGITAGVTGSWAGGWGTMLLLGAAEDLTKWTRKPYTVSISEKGVRNEAWPAKSVVKWSDVIKIMCVEDGVVIFRNSCGEGFFVPASAFENLVQAQQFSEQAVNYWRDATGRFRGTE